MKKLLLLSFSALLLSSCSQLAGKYGRAACACSEELVGILKEDKENPGSVNIERFNQAESNFENCMDGLNRRFKDLISQDQALKAIEESCPETYELMNM